MSTMLFAYIHLSKIVFAVLYFAAVPWVILDEGPALGIHGCLQLGFILLAIVLSLWRYSKLSAFERFQNSAIAYLAATLISNILAVMLIPHLLH